jgi:predicted membrane protein
MRLVRVWIGLVLLVGGVVGILGATGMIEAGSTLAKWWPVAVIGLGLVAMIDQRHVSLGPVVVTAVGVALLAGARGWTTQSVVAPAILIIVGLLVMSGLTRAGKTGERHQSLAVFSGSKIKESSEHLTHTGVSAIFGGATLDLRDAHIDHEASVDALAMFGGVDILVPEGWRVSLGGLPLFGGYDDKTHGNGSRTADSPLLKVNATAMFGGVTVANAPN